MSAQTIKGKVADKNDIIPFANVTITDNQNKIIAGTTSDDNGLFELKVAKGTYTFTVSYLGYTSWEKEINITQNLNLKTILLEEIKITANKVLPEKCSQIFKLRFYNQLSYKEIAIQLKISENTVENQVSKALKLLRNSTNYPVELILLLLFIQ